MREKESFQAAEDAISIPSDHHYDSESIGTSSEPASSSSKESTLPAKHSDDNEETPLKNHIRDHGHPKQKFKKNQEVTYQVWWQRLH